MGTGADNRTFRSCRRSVQWYRFANLDPEIAKCGDRARARARRRRRLRADAAIPALCRLRLETGELIHSSVASAALRETRYKENKIAGGRRNASGDEEEEGFQGMRDLGTSYIIKKTSNEWPFRILGTRFWETAALWTSTSATGPSTRCGSRRTTSMSFSGPSGNRRSSTIPSAAPSYSPRCSSKNGKSGRGVS